MAPGIPDDSRRWRLLEAILIRALDLSQEARDEFLDRECAGDEALRRDAQRLLESDASSGSFLLLPAAERVAPLVRALGGPRAGEPGLLHPGTRVGPYHLVREIARGGMGVVFLVERVDGHFEDRVCLKLLRADMGSEEILKRFLRERQILAWLRHPSIASLLDGGLTEQGDPYIVMEYVDGLPITEYCDERRLSVSDRLHLFRQVCIGVQHAHANLVVHRDLKPSNILVTREGDVKLLDFGIAKILGPSMDGSATVTEMRMLTPRYAAPEQIEGGPVTTAADVYSLGVVLYELLTAHSPFTRSTGIDLATRYPALRGADPARPSSVVARTASRPGAGGATIRQTPLEISRARSTQPQRLRQLLRGDLDNIILKALAAAPGGRYPSAAALEEDIERHLASLPVRARSPALSYRTSRFLRRHWVAAAAAGLVVLALLVGLAGTMWQARLAGRQARRAEAVTRFMTSLFESASPNKAQGHSIAVPRMLDHAAERIDRELQGQPEVQLEVLLILGKLYLTVGVHDKAESLLTRGLALGEVLYGPEDLHLLGSLASLATTHQEMGDLESAEQDFRRALAISRARLPGDDPRLAHRMNDLAVLLRQKGDIRGAERLQREVLARKRSLLGNDHADVSSTMNNLAVLLMETGEYPEAESLIREALRIRRRAYGEKSIEFANTLHNLMVLHRHRHQYQPAESLALHVLAMRRELLGGSHPAVGNSLFNLGGILHGQGSCDRAEALYRRSIAAMDSVLGADHPDVAGMRNVLAKLLREQGRTAEAEGISRDALAVMERRLPQDHPYRARVLLELGQNLMDQGRAVEAEQALRTACEIHLRIYGPGTTPTAESGVALGQCLNRLGRFDEARRELQAALAAYRVRLGEEDDRTAQARSALAVAEAVRPEE